MSLDVPPNKTFERIMRRNPSAAGIADRTAFFTGTPLLKNDHITERTFGGYVSIYDFKRAVEDKATVPLFYENRGERLQELKNPEINEEIAAALEQAGDMDASQLAKLEREFAREVHLLTAKKRLRIVAQDFVRHYSDLWTSGKAMFVCYNKVTCVQMYNYAQEYWQQEIKRLQVTIDKCDSQQEVQEMRRKLAWMQETEMAVVVSQEQNEIQTFQKWGLDILPHREKMEKRELDKEFKDPDSKFRVVFVCAMWLTGFDVKTLSCLYLDKPMKAHTLMQTIARANRVAEGKTNGLVVDYIGIAKALKEAMRDYTKQDQENYGNPDIKETALLKFKEKLEICRDFFHKFNYARFHDGTDADRAEIIKGAVNFMLAPSMEEQCNSFLKESLLLKNAVSLCRSLLNEEQRYEAAFFETVRTAINRIKNIKVKVSKKEINERIGELLKQSIKSEGVINLFSDVKSEFSLFDAAFLDEISKMKEKHIAIELLKKLLKERVHLYQRTNLVQAQKFSELINMALSNYLKGLLTNEEVIKELLDLAKEITQNEKMADNLGLNAEEKAFYDALTKPQAVKDFYTNEELVNLTKELTEELRKNRTIDWQKKESARAGMRSKVKRLLKKYKYPPEEEQSALETVIHQCEQWADVDSSDYNLYE